MATPKQWLDVIAGASGAVTALPSIPSGADNAIIRFDSGTARWSETTGSNLNASVGVLISAADAPIRISNLGAFRFCPVGGGATLQAAYYQGFFVL